jgi:hypothetical protein
MAKKPKPASRRKPEYYDSDGEEEHSDPKANKGGEDEEDYGDEEYKVESDEGFESDQNHKNKRKRGGSKGGSGVKQMHQMQHS